MNEFLKNFPFVDVIITNCITTYIERDVEIDRALPMLEQTRIERIDLYLDKYGNDKVIVYAEDVP